MNNFKTLDLRKSILKRRLNFEFHWNKKNFLSLKLIDLRDIKGKPSVICQTKRSMSLYFNVPVLGFCQVIQNPQPTPSNTTDSQSAESNSTQVIELTSTTKLPLTSAKQVTSPSLKEIITRASYFPSSTSPTPGTTSSPALSTTSLLPFFSTKTDSLPETSTPPPEIKTSPSSLPSTKTDFLIKSSTSPPTSPPPTTSTSSDLETDNQTNMILSIGGGVGGAVALSFGVCCFLNKIKRRTKKRQYARQNSSKLRLLPLISTDNSHSESSENGGHVNGVVTSDNSSALNSSQSAVVAGQGSSTSVENR